MNLTRCSKALNPLNTTVPQLAQTSKYLNNNNMKSMAIHRSCLHTLKRHFSSTSSFQNPKSLITQSLYATNHLLISNHPQISPIFNPYCCIQSKPTRHFSTGKKHYGKPEDNDEDDDEGELSESSGDEGEEEEFEGKDGEILSCAVTRTYSIEEKATEAAEIGYKVMGPLGPTEKPFKPWEPVFAVVQLGSHQFKVSNGDSIYSERLKFCEVNDKLLLNRVLMLGSKSQTIIGRPILPDTSVYAVVEEHVLDAKVIIFKKKRRKNYRRTTGHRQELTRLRITDIQGVEKPVITAVGVEDKSEKTAAGVLQKKESEAVPA